MKVFRNRLVLGILGIVLSAGICFFLAPMLNNAVNEQVVIIRVAKPIAIGTEITNEMLDTVTVGAANLSGKVIESKDEIVGKYATVNMLPDDYIFAEKLSTERQNAYLYKLPRNYQAISIPITSFAAGLSAKLQSGDIVTVHTSDAKLAEENGSFNYDMGLLEYVKVLAVTFDTGIDNDEALSATYAADGSKEHPVPSTVTLQVSPKQAELLAKLSKTHISLIYRGDNTAYSEELLKRQDAYETRIGISPMPTGTGLPNE